MNTIPPESVGDNQYPEGFESTHPAFTDTIGQEEDESSETHGSTPATNKDLKTDQPENVSGGQGPASVEPMPLQPVKKRGISASDNADRKSKRRKAADWEDWEDFKRGFDAFLKSVGDEGLKKRDYSRESPEPWLDAENAKLFRKQRDLSRRMKAEIDRYEAERDRFKAEVDN